MSAMATYQKSNLSWQLQLLNQNLREWLAWQRDRLWGQAPDFDLPQIDHWQWWEGFLLHSLLWVVIALAIAVIGLNYKTWRHYWLQFQGLSRQATPVAPPASIQQWGNLAQAAAQQGHYAQACRYLYLATLQTLHDRHLIDQSPARTDREYTSLVEGLPASGAYQTIFNLHQKLCFGSGTASPQLFKRFEQAFDLIRRSPSSPARITTWQSSRHKP